MWLGFGLVLRCYNHITITRPGLGDSDDFAFYSGASEWSPPSVSINGQQPLLQHMARDGDVKKVINVLYATAWDLGHSSYPISGHHNNPIISGYEERSL